MIFLVCSQGGGTFAIPKSVAACTVPHAMLAATIKIITNNRNETPKF